MINDLLGKNIAGKYRIDSLIRETELGDFYRGTNTSTGVPVTIKILAPAMAIDVRYVDRFLFEANAAARVSHRNILNSIDIGTDSQGLPYAVYEGIEGETLEETIKLYGPMAEARAIGVAKQVASAVAAIHSGGLIHGGLNPYKVLISTVDGVDSVKIYDLGVRSHAKNSMTAVPYIAPEQCIDSSRADQRSDVYSLGAILYEMIAGAAAFRGATPSAVIQKKAAEPPAPLSAYRDDLHSQLEPIILTAIAPDPDRRYQTMAAFEGDLDKLAADTGAKLPGDEVLAAAPVANPARSMWKTAAIVLVGIAVLSAGLIYATYTRQTNPTTTAEADVNSSPVQPINAATGAQEEAMLRMGDLGDASILPGSGAETSPGALPGGDGYNAWAAGGVPPAGAPLNSSPGSGSVTPIGAPMPAYVPPPGQTVTIDPNGGSQFMPNEGGVILVPIPKNPEPKASPTPKSPAAGTTAKPTPDPKAPSTTNPAGTQPDSSKTSGKPANGTSTKKPATTKPGKTANGPSDDPPPSR
ncbi:MAG: protein kinase [Acidobacteriota bacterium]